jgi:hypothetical protein
VAFIILTKKRWLYKSLTRYEPFTFFSPFYSLKCSQIRPSGSVPTVKLPSPGNTALKFSLSPVEKFTPAVEVVSDEEDDDEDDEEPQANLALRNSSDNTVLKPSLSPVENYSTVEVVSDEEDDEEEDEDDEEPQADLAFGNSSDNTVSKPSLSPVENYPTVEVVDEEDESTTPPMSPRCLNAMRTIPEGSENEDLSNTTVSPTSMDRNMREDKDTLAKQVQVRPSYLFRGIRIVLTRRFGLF